MKKEVRNFDDLEVWQKAHHLTLEIYKITKDFPKVEIFGITNQLRKVASSISANISEGFERYYPKDKSRFYYQARGSIAEVQNFLLLARDLGFIDNQAFQRLYEQTNTTRQLLNGLIRSTSKQE